MQGYKIKMLQVICVCIESHSCSGSYRGGGLFAALVAYNMLELRKA